jgi:hypothetical protein
MIGYIIAYKSSQPGPCYAAIFIATCGGFPDVALFLTWAGSNAGGNTKRGIVMGLVIGLGNLGGCVSHLGSRLGVNTAAHRLDCHTTGSVLHSSTINLHVFIRATAQH